MFKLKPNPTFTVPVPITVPGMPEPISVSITFRHKNKAALRTWMTEGFGKTDAALLHELIVEWSGMQDEAGENVPYSLTALTDLIDSYWAAREEITDAYLVELKESKAKNSVRLPAA
jgi:hypothetical protein